MKSLIAKLFILFAISFTFNACVFEDFDEPPVGNLPSLTGNITIEQIKAQHTLGSDAAPIQAIGDESPVLAATVVGDDAFGNIFKQLYLEDETGGIIIRLDEIGLNGLYPVGTPVVIDLSNLYIGDFAGNYQLGIAGGDRVPASLVRSTVYANGNPLTLTPTVLNITDLSNDETFARYQSTLVQFDAVQFSGLDANASYADAANQQSLNRTLTDCEENTIIVRSSGFADFASELTPAGNGTIVAILTAFNDTRQLVVRSPQDLNMTAERCGVIAGGDIITIEELRAQYTGSETTISDETSIRGVVISDRLAGNQQSRNLVLQDGGSGIVIRFTTDHNFALGTDLEIAVSGQELSEFRGLLQVNNLNIDNATAQGIIPLPTPREATVGELLANGETWESTLVKIDPATVSGGPTYGDGLNVTDDSGANIEIFSLFSVFADNTAETGEGSVTAILSQYEENYQLQINSPNDVDVDGGMTGEEMEITAGELRSLFAGGGAAVPANRYIEGVVVSDVFAGNFNNQNAIVQTGETGIVIRFSDPHAFPLGQTIKVSIGGQELGEFNSLLQINGVPLTNASDEGPGSVEPRETTIAEILTNGEEWESTVVTVEDLSFDGVTNFPDANMSIFLTDGTNSIPAFIRTDATFGGQAVPTGPFTATFVVTQFGDDFQATIRNLDDFE